MELSPNKENRIEGRSNVFLSGTLDASGVSFAVRIRNLSPNGALVEAAKLPRAGTTVRLLRGSLSATGEFAWHGGGHGGIKFQRSIEVARWVQRVGHAGQQRIDMAVAAIQRSEPVPRELERVSETDSLASISTALDQLCERLAATSNMSVELAEDLLRLDAIAQDLRLLAAARKV